MRLLHASFGTHVKDASKSHLHCRFVIPLHLWNPTWKPREALLRSAIRAKNTALAKRQANSSDAAGRAPLESSLETGGDLNENGNFRNGNLIIHGYIILHGGDLNGHEHFKKRNYSISFSKDP